LASNLAVRRAAKRAHVKKDSHDVKDEITMGGSLLSKKSRVQKKVDNILPTDPRLTRKFAAYLGYLDGEYDYLEEVSEPVKTKKIKQNDTQPSTASIECLTEEILQHIFTYYLPHKRQHLVLRLVSSSFRRLCQSVITPGQLHLSHLPVVYQGLFDHLLSMFYFGYDDC
jgi:hypothetical protein